MKTVWTKGLDADEAKEVRIHFKGGVQLRKRLASILNDKIRSARAKSRSDELYDSPNWSIIQAGLIEREKAYLEVISLLLEEN